MNLEARETSISSATMGEGDLTDAFTGMPYTEAFIIEGLRHGSMIPLGTPHIASTDTKINGYFIPKKFTFCVPRGHPIPPREANGSFIINSPKPYKVLLRERLHDRPWGVHFLGCAPFPFGGCLYEKFHRLKERYGDVFYMNPAGKDVVVLREGSLIWDEFGRFSVQRQMRPRRVQAFRQQQQRPDSFSTFYRFGLVGSSGSLRHENRRFTVKILRDSGLGKAPKLNATILQEVLKICEIVGRNENEPEDLRLPIHVAVLNIIWKLTAGQTVRKEVERRKQSSAGLIPSPLVCFGILINRYESMNFLEKVACYMRKD
ncbi:unnamed protein product [Darwinula stevensoni]|uniref:Cytochrome P450 n=1 Tax=Darwinula stevensoni TaxID=69355 RepID=A0A7R9A291_9CRUS|nr:unnamed protein product [Darwinula stevensoni]CAG0889210.1 unnamed protein product [Darwinula stevensoni]